MHQVADRTQDPVTTELLPEGLFSLADVPAVVERRTGERVHRTTAWRWAMHGVAGVKLRCVCRGGTGFWTCERWLAEFFTAVAEARLARRVSR